MNRHSLVVGMLFIVGLMTSGCAGNSGLGKAVGISTRQDVFREAVGATVAEAGYAELRIYAALKTHKAGIYGTTDSHGTPDYKLLVNIGGQSIALSGVTREGNSDARNLREPESGAGVGYQFSKKLRVRTGTHRVVIALPGDNIAVEKSVTLAEGTLNSLVVEPVYGAIPGQKRPGFYGLTSFQEGIRSIRVILNGQPI
jgi:hypothetical protein